MPGRSTTPGYMVVYPNREKARSKVTKLIVVVLLLVSVVLMLLLTIGGWSKLQGLKVVDLIWIAVYLILAFYVGFRWSRGALTMAAAGGIMLLLIAVVAAAGLAGTDWFQRHAFGYAAPQTLFGGKGLSPNVLGAITVLVAPVQALLIAFATLGFAQSWGVETEIPIEEARKRGYKPPAGSGSGSSSPKPATA